MLKCDICGVEKTAKELQLIDSGEKVCAACLQDLRGEQSTIPCRFCAEPVSPQAVKCKHCGEWLGLRPKSQIVVPMPMPQVPNIIIHTEDRTPTAPHRTPKETNGLGVASLVMGIIAALSCWIPFVGIIAIPFAVLGLIFAIIGFLVAAIGRRSGVGMPFSGGVVCVIALWFAVTTTGVLVSALSRVKEASSPQSASLPTQPVTANPASIPPATTAPTYSIAEQKKDYMPLVLIQNLKVGQTTLDEPGIFGEIKNTGNRTLKEVEIMVYCLDRSGNRIFERKFYPVFVPTDSIFTVKRHDPLKPNYTEKWGYSLEDAPSDWSKEVEVYITNIEFAD